MINLYLAQELADDKLRDAEKSRLRKIASQSRYTQIRKHLALLACRLGLVQIC